MITFHGIYHKTIRRNFENGKTLFAIKPTETVEYVNKYGDVTCYASMHPIMKQTPVEIKGEVMQSRMGPYILVQSITETFDDRNALISYRNSTENANGKKNLFLYCKITCRSDLR